MHLHNDGLAPSASSSTSPSHGHQDEQLVFYIPSPLHPDAYSRCSQLGIDVIRPEDTRSKTWWECELNTRYCNMIRSSYRHSACQYMPGNGEAECSLSSIHCHRLKDTDAIVWRQGSVKEDYGLAKKLKIIARNGKGAA